MHTENKQLLKLKLNKKTVILLGENAEKYKTGNQQGRNAKFFTNGGTSCYTTRTKQSYMCTLDCTLTD